MMIRTLSYPMIKWGKYEERLAFDNWYYIDLDEWIRRVHVGKVCGRVADNSVWNAPISKGAVRWVWRSVGLGMEERWVGYVEHY